MAFYVKHDGITGNDGESADCDEHDKGKKTGEKQGPGKRHPIPGPGDYHGSHTPRANHVSDYKQTR